jgi:hypothetical protein
LGGIGAGIDGHFGGVNAEADGAINKNKTTAIGYYSS